MSVHRLDSIQNVPVSLDEAWEFFSDPHNLALITPPSLGFKITTDDLPPHVYEGLIITYTVKPLLNIPMKWVTEITHVRECEFFVDEQRVGPYAFWHHQHHFREMECGVEVRDIVHYAAPFGPLGDLIVRVQVKPKLAKIFGFRQRVLEGRYGKMPSPQLFSPPK